MWIYYNHKVSYPAITTFHMFVYINDLNPMPSMPSHLQSFDGKLPKIDRRFVLINKGNNTKQLVVLKEAHYHKIDFSWWLWISLRGQIQTTKEYTISLVVIVKPSRKCIFLGGLWEPPRKLCISLTLSPGLHISLAISLGHQGIWHFLEDFLVSLAVGT